MGTPHHSVDHEGCFPLYLWGDVTKFEREKAFKLIVTVNVPC